MTSKAKEEMSRGRRVPFWIYIILLVLVMFPFDMFGYRFMTSPVALFLGLAFAFIFECPVPQFNKKASKYLLQVAVVALGFKMNIDQALQSGSDGMLFTIVSVIGVMLIGTWLARWLGITRKIGYLISSGTAICGGSAIGAVGPVVKADAKEMSVSLGVIFILNAIALFIFPPIGHYFDLSQEQFGTWAAIAIHDTSSVVGAGMSYGQTALDVATVVKLTRALWIIPLALVTMLLFREKGQKVTIPWFIFIFIAVIILNTYVAIPPRFSAAAVWFAEKGMVVTLFLIGASLSRKMIRSVGTKPLILAVLLWLVIGISSLIVVKTTMG